MTPSKALEAVRFCVRRLAGEQGVRVSDGLPVRVNPEDDSLYIQMRVEPLQYLAELTIDGDVLRAPDGPGLFEMLSAEFERACAEARGHQIAALLSRPVRTPKDKREQLCDRLTGLIMTLAKNDTALCENLALKLMERVERVPR